MSADKSSAKKRDNEKTSDILPSDVQHAYEELQEGAKTLAEVSARNQALLESIGDGIIATDQDGRMTLVNDSAERMLGKKREKILGKSMVEEIPLVDEKGKAVPLYRRPAVLALSNGKKTSQPQGVTYYYERSDGSRFPVGITVTPFVLGERIVGTIVVFRDITIETDIDRAKTEFVSLASHQLRTPLATIRWYAEMLRDESLGKLNEEQKEYLNTMYKSNLRMIDLVDALLNVSRLELGTFIIEPEETDLVDLAKSVLEELAVKIQAKSMQIETKYEPEKIVLSVDPKLTRIIFQNLLSNAIKYTPGKGKVSLSVEQKHKEVLIKVADTGYGIPKADQDKIFTKLFRADNVKTKETEGTGLGLYIIRQILETAGGKIWFESEENKGTTFYVSLPLEGMKQKKGTKSLA